MHPDLVEIVASVLNAAPSELTLETGPKNFPKWDSLTHVTIASAVEQAYGVHLTMPEILSIRSIANIQEILHRHGVV